MNRQTSTMDQGHDTVIVPVAIKAFPAGVHGGKRVRGLFFSSEKVDRARASGGRKLYAATHPLRASNPGYWLVATWNTAGPDASHSWRYFSGKCAPRGPGCTYARTRSREGTSTYLWTRYSFRGTSRRAELRRKRVAVHGTGRIKLHLRRPAWPARKLAILLHAKADLATFHKFPGSRPTMPDIRRSLCPFRTPDSARIPPWIADTDRVRSGFLGVAREQPPEPETRRWILKLTSASWKIPWASAYRAGCYKRR